MTDQSDAKGVQYKGRRCLPGYAARVFLPCARLRNGTGSVKGKNARETENSFELERSFPD
eukprot:1194171-Prorocentrum_minimum.AAC.3